MKWFFLRYTTLPALHFILTHQHFPPMVNLFIFVLGLNGKIQGIIVGKTPLRSLHNLQNGSMVETVEEGATVDWETTGSEVWYKPLADGQSVGVVFLNLDDNVSVNVTATLSSIGIDPKVRSSVYVCVCVCVIIVAMHHVC